MPKAPCPACGRNITLHGEDIVLYETVVCPHCDATLEIVDESPLMLEEISD